MTKPQLEHLLRASAAITGATEIVVVGSQSVLGAAPDPPAELLSSHEADLFTFRSAEDAALIEGSIGDGSPFHETFGYCAHGVGEETSTLPAGWRERLLRLRSASTGGATGLCLEVHDLAVSKLVAGRPKDLEYLGAMVRHRLIQSATMRARLSDTVLEGSIRDLALARLERLEKEAGVREG